jgi:hypothetical protein
MLLIKDIILETLSIDFPEVEPTDAESIAAHCEQKILFDMLYQKVQELGGDVAYDVNGQAVIHTGYYDRTKATTYTEPPEPPVQPEYVDSSLPPAAEFNKADYEDYLTPQDIGPGTDVVEVVRPTSDTIEAAQDREPQP